MTMMGIWELKKIALRNLSRHRVKTFLTSAAIMVSVAVYIALNSMLSGMSIESRRNIVNYEMGAAKLQTKIYFEKKSELPSYENFSGWTQYRDALEREGYVSAPRYVFSGTLFSSSLSAPVLFHAVEPGAEREVLRYVPYIDFGRYIQNGNFEIVLGTVAGEKLKVGIPTRPRLSELDELIGLIAHAQTPWSPADRDFILSLYDAADERMVLKNDASHSDLQRYWDMIARTGRNDVRINAVIDIKAVPEMIRSDKWEGELMPALRNEDRLLVASAYEYEDFLEAYLLYEEDEALLDNVLAAMIRADYSGAVRHVNQLVNVTVSGVINCPNPYLNGNIAFIPLDVLQDEAGMMLEGAITELLIREKNVPDTRLPGKSESAEAISAALRRGLEAQGQALPDELDIRTWLDYSEDFLGAEVTESGFQKMVVYFLFLLSFLGISNTILLAILERTREIGMMRALGMNDRQLIITFMLEAGFLGFIGSILGTILGCVINYYMVVHGIDVSSMHDVSAAFMYRTRMEYRSVWDFSIIIGSGIVATLLASFMAIFPTFRAVKQPITESLRFD